MEFDDEQKQYAELTPVVLESPDGSRTEAKVPYSTHSEDNTPVHTTGNSFDSSFSARPFNTNEMVPTSYAHRRSGDVNGGVSGNDSTSCDDGRTVDVGNDDGDREHDGGYVENAVYRELVLLFRELPKEMFVNRL